MSDSESEFKFMKPGEIRTRFAPSPTGSLHIGTSRTCLFNFLFTRKNQGVFVLRIEDTDTERSKLEYEKDIMESLKWLGIEWDEGPDIGGNYGPYRQRERLDIYEKYLKQLLKEKKAYYCFCSQEDLEARRQYLMSIGKTPIYDGKCSNLSESEIKKNIAQGKKFVIRFRTPSKKIVFEDLIRGKVEFDTALIGDFVIAKDLNYPLYNFSCVVDDFDMKISHVIRGEDHISNTPKQILIQEALGFPSPKYAHLSLILAPDRTKLSKRHGVVSVNDFKKLGYLPEALVNFIAFLGWNPGNEREIYSMASLIKEFSLERVQKPGAIFNTKRLDFLNGFYIRQKPIDHLTRECLPYLIEAGLLKEKGGEGFETPEFEIKETGETIDFNVLQRIIVSYQERLKKLSEISGLTDFFFKDKLEYKKELLRWKNQTDSDILASLDRLGEVLFKIEKESWQRQELEKNLLAETEKFSQPGDRGYLLWPLRAALTGKEASSGPFEIAEILGKEKTLKRIKQAKELITNK